MGHSNGGFMTHRLACEHGDRFAAAVSLAGGANIACNPGIPVPILEIHGDADTTIAYGGGTNPGASTPYPSVEETLGYWAAANECEGTHSEIESREMVCDSVTDETHVERYSGCAADVELWRIASGSHVPIFHEPQWGNAVVDFMLAHSR
jgi:polyhydroxybutyrate depolymerase